MKQSEQKELLRIARERLGLETLESRHSDSLDFTEQAIWQIRAALEDAFEAGKAAGKAEDGKTIIVLEGGLISAVISDRPGSYLTVDRDTEGADEAEIRKDQFGEDYCGTIQRAEAAPHTTANYYRAHRESEKKGASHARKL